MAEAERQYSALVVEDDPSARELLQFNLTEAGFTTFAVDSAPHGFDILRKEIVDIIVCDVMIPGTDGFEFREEILKDPSLREIAFVFLTAKTMAEDQIRGLSSGVDEYITKPFDPQVLIARIHAVLARRESFARLARLDPLTQLANRSTLEREITRELDRLKRYPDVATLVFLDVDGFKSINDSLGHAEGDRVLVHLASVLKANSRATDIVGRYGGEEFVVFFPATSEDHARGVVERMHDGFQLAYEGYVGKQRLTFSAGLVEAPRDGADFPALCDRADTAMYTAKRNGKARLVVWTHELDPMGQSLFG
ncbi:MAG: diguanylate cyclase [Candidatus Hydrogenedentes bacterium]|nr:diguanylate cyclase [Candidatus Hydrogenedentota bacterium]